MMNRWRALLMAGICCIALPAIAGEAPSPGEPPRVDPSAGQTLTWHHARYLVVNVAAPEALDIGLKAVVSRLDRLSADARR